MTSTESETDRASRNKEIIRSSYEQFFEHGDVTGLAEVIDENFVQHSPDAPSGRDAYLRHLAEAAFAGGTSHIKLLIADGDFVAVHHNMILRGADGEGLAVVDLWRLRDGKIVEHWDVEQPVPDRSRIPNGMF
jgi:predicted SnoaL-like aldol condensation-catalyzing enzyme